MLSIYNAPRPDQRQVDIYLVRAFGLRILLSFLPHACTRSFSSWFNDHHPSTKAVGGTQEPKKNKNMNVLMSLAPRATSCPAYNTVCLSIWLCSLDFSRNRIWSLLIIILYSVPLDHGSICFLVSTVSSCLILFSSHVWQNVDPYYK